MSYTLPRRCTDLYRALPRALQGAIALWATLLTVFGDVLFSDARVLSQNGTDLTQYFASSRAFGFDSLRHGIIPQWNPYSFSGMPYAADFQSALFYPVNWVHLLLPHALALNWEIVLNLFIAGFGMFVWSGKRGCSLTASILSGLLLMFGMPYFLRIFAGHLAPLGAMAWIPWIFCAIDQLIERPTIRTTLLAGTFGGLQLLAGHPQTSFYTAIAAFIYLACRGTGTIFSDESHPASTYTKRAIALLAVPVFSVALAAIQIFPGLAIISETVRSQVSYDFAATFSLPPRNAITLVAPFFFGDVNHVTYWGKWYLWEDCLFFGVTGLVLALYGLCSDKKQWLRFGLPIAILALFALGGYTPFFHILYDFMPGFDRLRGASKFVIEMTVLLVALAASGYDNLQKLLGAGDGTARPMRKVFRLQLLLGSVSVVLLAAAFWISHGGDSWYSIVRGTVTGGDSYFNGSLSDFDFLATSAHFATTGLVIASGSLILLIILLGLARRHQRMFKAVAILCVAEVWVAAAHMRPTVGAGELAPANEKAALAGHVIDDARVLDVTHSNRWPLLQVGSAWGYNPFVLRRTIQFMALTQGQNPDSANYSMPITQYSPLLRLLRCRYAYREQAGTVSLAELPKPLPHLSLMGHYRLANSRDGTLATLADQTFKPDTEVVLESRPAVEPRPAAIQGTARIIGQTVNSLDIEADVKSPSLLLVTDAYARGWTAEPMAGDSQADYQVLPADLMLRAIPLQAGKHRFRVVYRAPGFALGAWVSVLTVMALIGILGFYELNPRNTITSATDM